LANNQSRVIVWPVVVDHVLLLFNVFVPNTTYHVADKSVVKIILLEPVHKTVDVILLGTSVILIIYQVTTLTFEAKSVHVIVILCIPATNHVKVIEKSQPVEIRFQFI